MSKAIYFWYISLHCILIHMQELEVQVVHILTLFYFYVSNLKTIAIHQEAQTFFSEGYNYKLMLFHGPKASISLYF